MWIVSDVRYHAKPYSEYNRQVSAWTGCQNRRSRHRFRLVENREQSIWLAVNKQPRRSRHFVLLQNISIWEIIGFVLYIP